MIHTHAVCNGVDHWNHTAMDAFDVAYAAGHPITWKPDDPRPGDAEVRSDGTGDECHAAAAARC